MKSVKNFYNMESVIKWQTGTPTKSGWYIVSTKDNKVTFGVFTESGD